MGWRELATRFARARSETPNRTAVTPTQRARPGRVAEGFLNFEWTHSRRPNQSALARAASALCHEGSQVRSWTIPPRRNSIVRFQRHWSDWLTRAAWRPARDRRAYLEEALNEFQKLFFNERV